MRGMLHCALPSINQHLPSNDRWVTMHSTKSMCLPCPLFLFTVVVPFWRRALPLVILSKACEGLPDTGCSLASRELSHTDVHAAGLTLYVLAFAGWRG